MTVATQMIKDLLANGVHFGHQTNKWHPKMEKYIFGEKNGIYIIDLRKTEEALTKAMEFAHELSASGKTILFVGTKKQAKTIIKREAQRCGMFYVDERWLGGCLTNFNTVRKSVDRLNHLQEVKASEMYNEYAKKEKARIDREENKLLKNLAGIRDMQRIPDAVFVVDAELEDIAIKEARKLGLPVIALIDTNCDPNVVDHPIPGNDDAIRSIEYIVSQIASAVERGVKESAEGKQVKDMRTVASEAGKEKEEPAAETPADEPEAPSEESSPGQETTEDIAEPVEEEKVAAEDAPLPESRKDEEKDTEDAPAGDIKLDS